MTIIIYDDNKERTANSAKHLILLICMQLVLMSK